MGAMSAITSPARAASQAAVAAPAPIRASLSAPPLVIHDAPDPVAVDLARPEAIAATILAGFDRHYALFRYNAQQAKSRYEAGDWHAIRRLARSRITFYDQRVREGVARLQAQYTEGDLAESAWACCWPCQSAASKRFFASALACRKRR